MKKYANEFTVKLMSKVLEVSSSGYYKWLSIQARKQPVISMLDTEIKESYKKSFMTYGSPRIAIDLQKKGISCSKSTVARRMRKLNIVARPKRRFVVTTDSSHDYKISPNLLERNFQVETLNTVWVSDITYVRADNKWMYLTTFIDLADRMVVGWSLSKNMTANDTVCNAYEKAIQNRSIGVDSGLMIHSDRGVQYASKEFREAIKLNGCVQSMSRKGNCWDNAVAESFFKTIKTEALNRYTFNSIYGLESVIFRYIDGFYNTIRLHSSLGNISPKQASLLKNFKTAA